MINSNTINLVLHHLESCLNTKVKAVPCDPDITKADVKLDQILKNKRSIYFSKKSGRTKANVTWETPKQWKAFAKKNTLNLHHIKMFNIKYGDKFNRKYGVIRIISYTQAPDIIQTKKYIEQLIQESPVKDRYCTKIEIYNDENLHELNILTRANMADKTQ